MTHASLRGRSLLRPDDFSARETAYVLDLADQLKQERRHGREWQRLAGKRLALVFEKDSTRTRSGFEVAAYDQGAHVTYIGPSGSHLGHKETVKDTARVLGRLYDGIEYRGFGQAVVEEMVRWAGVPVWNGLTTEHHPTQALADLLTMREHAAKPFAEMRLCFLGDAACNTAGSLLIGCALLGVDVRVAAPAALFPPAPVQAACERLGAPVTATEDLAAAVAGCDFLYTDVWLSMGEDEALWGERIALLSPYRVDAAAMRATGNPQARFMHCLPAFHNAGTEVGRQVRDRFGIDCMEVTEEVFESPASIVFDQAENRMHTIKALLVATLVG